MVTGLNGAEHYNGKFGMVKEIMEKEGEERLCAVLDGDGRQLSVKRSNAEVHIHVQRAGAAAAAPGEARAGDGAAGGGAME
jgi:hypothetical protein